MIIDDFFEDPKSVRDEILRQGFKMLKSPVDGVEYPGICHPLSDSINAEVRAALQMLDVAPGKAALTFARQSPDGVKAPHQAHTDAIMGAYTLLIYMNETYEEGVGTEIVEHVSGLRMHPANKDEEALWAGDTNEFDKWKRVTFCPAKFNRAFLIDSHLYHRALPVTGAGTGDDARLVVISFFNL